MKKIGRYIALFLVSSGMTTFLVFTSFSFGAEGNQVVTNTFDNHTITVTLPIEGDNGLEYTPLSGKEVEKNTIFATDFGRLANGFFLSKEQGDITDFISRDEKNITIDTIDGIVSWYDPFTNYTLSDKNQTFRMTQITNGSMYVSHEDDGTILLYSIDMVGELVFLANGTEKTKMILFPGMYFRFDPIKNTDMQDADLLRIIQVQQGSEKRTKIAFVNARIEGGNAGLIPYFLLGNQNARKLFHFIEQSSQHKMKAVDLLKDYTKTNTQFSHDDNGVLNPTKKMYRVLGELQIIFSHAINGEMEVVEFEEKIKDILQKTKELDMDNIAEHMIQQFLIDGRFALFSENKLGNGHYERLYDSAANILGITPTTPKGKMFQVLSNIFSRNIIDAKVPHKKLAVDTIGVLHHTLANGEYIATSDYFDMSLYSFLLLHMMADDELKRGNVTIDTAKNNELNSVQVEKDTQAVREKNLKAVFYDVIFSRSTLEDASLYNIYSVIFKSTQKYVDGMKDPKQVENAQGILMDEFYIPMMHLLANSLYQAYTTNETGQIHLRESFINRGVPELSVYNHKEIVNELTNLLGLASDIYERRLKIVGSSDKVRAKAEMKKYLIQIEGFIQMLDSMKYRSYQESPYLSERNSPLPEYNASKNELKRKHSLQVTEGVQERKKMSQQDDKAKGDTNDERQKISKILSTLLAHPILADDIEMRASGMYYTKIRHNNAEVSFLFHAGSSSISELVIDDKIQMQFSDTMRITSMRDIFSKLLKYEAHIEKIIVNNQLGDIKQLKIHYGQKRIQIGSKFFPLVP